MSDNNTDVVLVTRDTQLQELVARHRPPTARLRCLAPAELPHAEPTPAQQWWVDLDSGIDSVTGASGRRVYFYTRFPRHASQLPTGLFLRKPCAVSVVNILWAGVPAPAPQSPQSSRRPEPGRPPVLPAWVLDLHELDLRKLCHHCIKKLPPRLGYAHVALYLHDADQDLLTLAETNCERPIDLAIPLDPQNQHVLASVARSGRPLITQDLAEACRTAGLRCLPDLERAPNRAAVIAPLISHGKLRGVLQLTRREHTGLNEVGLPLDHLFSFLARSLQHARQYRRARVEARVDRLTGLFNYRWIVEALGKEIRRAQRYGSALALIMIDLDGLKGVNDRFGHLAGDGLLRHAAGKISASLRQIDSAARIGGDEFVVLLPATDLDGARRVAQRILTAVRTDAPVVGRRPLPVAASLGVAQWRPDWEANRLLQAADKAMYGAKREGQNRLVCHPHAASPQPAVPTPARDAR